MNLVIGLEAKKCGRCRSWGESAVFCLASISGEAFTVSSDYTTSDDTDGEADATGGEEAPPTGKEASSEHEGSP